MKRAAPKTAQPADRLRAKAEARAADAAAGTTPGHGAEMLAHELQVHQIELEMQNDELRRAQVALEAARDRYVELYDHAPVGYLTLDADGSITEANLTSARMLGAERARLVGRRFARHVVPTDADRWHRFERSLMQRGQPGFVELALTGRNGRRFHARVDGVHAEPACGAAPGLRITLTDITEHTRTEAELRLAAAAFEAQEGIMITDAQGVIERVNQAFTRITGYSADEAVGRSGRLLQSGRHDAAFYAALWGRLLSTGSWQGELWNRRKDGEVYPQWLTIAAVHSDGPEVTHYVATMQDISQRKSREDEIAQLAFYDPLTGLPNRRLMKDRLHQAMAVSARAHREGALMFIDLDHFKDVNDTLGHDKGDLLLQQVAQRLTACVRECDTVARPGGDEFVVMLTPDLSESPEAATAQAKAAGEKIRAALARPYQIAGHEYQGSVSIGVTLFSNHQFTVDELLRRADQAMYQAKAGGRNTLRFFDSAVQQTLRRRSTLETELRLAVQRGEFVLHYQPAFDRRHRLVGAEALVRWQHPSRGLVPPDEFIAVAEDTGLIHPLGRWVLEAACAQLAAWSTDAELSRLHLSVNISARQWHGRRFVQQVRDALEHSGANPALLQLELTESMMLDDVEDTIAKMNDLKAQGVGFSLDDFGTGYSSLTYLKRLPLDQLKIDRSFVKDVLTDAHDAAIARTIIELGRNLGLTVIAEGVETTAQRDLLASFGCQVFQGDLFGRPAPAQALHRLMQA